MEYLNEFNFAKSILKEAGIVISQKEHKVVLSSEAKDIKLALDLEIDNLIVERLTAKFEHPVLSEENGLTKLIEGPTPYWILDPIDGSMNLERGIPLSCTSLAFWMDHEPIFGIIYDYNKEEMISGYTGQGAWLNGALFTGAKSIQMDQSVLATGIPKDMDLSDANAGSFIEKLRQYKKVRMLGSAAISLSYLALGRVDTYIEKNIKFWDVAAGIAILKALNKTPKNFELKEDYLVDLEISN